MPLKNTKTEYGSVTKFFHWSIALLFVWQYGTAIVFGTMQEGPPKWDIQELHKTAGAVILILVILRFTWRKMTKLPDWAPTLTDWEKSLSHFVERGLYIAMFVMTLSGFWMEMFGGYKINLFGLVLKGWVPKNETVFRVLVGVHIATGFALVALLSAHIGLVVKHQVVDKDGFVKRMLPFTKQP